MDMSIADFSLCPGRYLFSFYWFSTLSMTGVICVVVWGAEDQMQGMLPLLCMAVCQSRGSESNQNIFLLIVFNFSLSACAAGPVTYIQ